MAFWMQYDAVREAQRELGRREQQRRHPAPEAGRGAGELLRRLIGVAQGAGPQHAPERAQGADCAATAEAGRRR